MNFYGHIRVGGVKFAFGPDQDRGQMLPTRLWPQTWLKCPAQVQVTLANCLGHLWSGKLGS